MNSRLPELTASEGFDPQLPSKMGKLQQQFAAHIRDPDNQSAPAEVEDRRMAIYRELFYNNIEGFAEASFPVIRKLFSSAEWHKLVRKFFAEYRCHTPLFPEISREFIRFLETQNIAGKPFLNELAHYEWVEMALDLDDTKIDLSDIEPDGDLLQGKPVLSPQAWVLRYEWPVHQISPDYQPQEKPESPIFLLVNRDQNEQIKFTKLNQVSARLLELVAVDDQLSGADCLLRISRELGRDNDAAILNAGAEMLEDFRTKKIIIGSKPNP